MNSYSLFVGADIAAKSVALAWRQNDTTEQMMIDQTPADYKRLAKRLRQLAAPSQTLVVLEATGNYWLALATWLYNADFVVSVINPVQARYFAKLQLQRAKTDQIDALLLADFARVTQPDPWTPPPAIYHRLQQRLAQREDLIGIKTQERNRLHALHHHPAAERTIIQRLQRHIRFLEREIKTLDQQLDDLLLGDHAWASAARRLLTIKGIGLITTSWILVATHCFARCQTPDQAAAFAGLAPHPRDSGSSLKGHRHVGKTGHAALRRSLYMAAGSATRFNPPVKTFYDRLVQRGKLKKVARCAAARKLLHIAWAVVVNERDFDPNWGQHQPVAHFAA